MYEFMWFQRFAILYIVHRRTVHGMSAFHVASALVSHELIYCCSPLSYAFSFHFILAGSYGLFLFYTISSKGKSKIEGNSSKA